MKGVANYSFLSQCIARDKEKIELGLQWDEEISPMSGEVMNIRYHFPISQCAAAARAYNVRTSVDKNGMPTPLDIEMKRDLAEQFAFGSVTRQLKSGANIGNIIANMINGNFEDIEEVLSVLARGVAQNYISGSTRVLAPFQTIWSASQTDPDNGLKKVVPNKNTIEALVWNSSRYFHDILDSVGIDVLEETDKLTSGKLNIDSSDLIPESTLSRDTLLEPTQSTYSLSGDLIGMKGVAPKTSVELLLGKANMAVWPLKRAVSPQQDHVYNNIIAPMLEDRAFSLRNSETFIEASIGERKKMVKGMLAKAKNDFDDMIFKGIVNTHMRPEGVDSDQDMTSFLRRIRSLQRIATLSKRDRQDAIIELNKYYEGDKGLQLDPSMSIKEFFETTNEKKFEDQAYFAMLLEMVRKNKKKGKLEGEQEHYDLRSVIRESTGERFNSRGELVQ